jgi:WD40 repeat protein
MSIISTSRKLFSTVISAAVFISLTHADEGASIDELPRGAIARLGTSRVKCLEPFSSALSPNGKYLAAVEIDGSFSVWEVPSGMPILRVGRKARFRAVAISKRGLVVAGNSTDVLCYNIKSGKQIATHSVPDSSISRLAISPDGMKLAIAYSSGISLRDIETGKETLRFANDAGKIESMSFSPDGKFVAVASAGHTNDVILWNIDNGKQIRGYSQDSGTSTKVISVAFSPDGRTLAAATMVGLRLWDIATGKATGSAEHGRSVAFSPDGRRVAVIEDENTVRLLNATSGKIERQLVKSDWGLQNLSFSEDGRLLLAGGTRPTIWNLENNKEVWGLSGHWYEIVDVCFARNGALLATTDHHGEICLWDTKTWKLSKQFAAPQSLLTKPFRCDFFDDDKVLGIFLSGRTVFRKAPKWDIKSSHDLRGGAVSPDGQFLAAWTNEAEGENLDGIDIYAMPSGKKIKSIPNPFLANQRGRYSIDRLVFSPDSKTLILVVTNDSSEKGKELLGKIIALDVKSGAKKADISGNEKGGASVSISPDGRFVAASHVFYHREIVVSEASSGKRLYSVQSRGRFLGFSPDTKLFLTAEPGGGLQFWETLTGQQICRYAGGHRDGITCLAWSPNGKNFCTGSIDSTILVWNTLGEEWKPALKKPLEAEILEAAWRNLGADDPAKGYEAIRILVSSPDNAVSILKSRLHPSIFRSSAQIEQLIKDLDSPSFKTRQVALDALKKCELQAAVSLKKSLLEVRSAESRRSIESLLDALPHVPLTREHLQQTRAVQALEWIGNEDAHKFLSDLAKGAPGTMQTEAASAAIIRLKR